MSVSFLVVGKWKVVRKAINGNHPFYEPVGHDTFLDKGDGYGRAVSTDDC